MSKLSRRAWMVMLVVVLGVAVVLVVGRARAREADAQMLATWKAELGGQTFPERFPSRPTNSAAVELDRIVAEIGIDLLGLEATGNDLDAPSVDSELTLGLTKVRLYLTTLNASKAGKLPAPAEELQEFRQRAAPVTQAVIAALNEGPLPQWGMDLSRGFEAPIPNFLGQLQLVDLLVFEAMEQSRTGTTEAALEALEAAWRLSGTAREMPYLISQLIANSQVKRHLLALRQMCDVPAVWGERLRELDPHQGLTRAFHGEAWVAYHTASLDELPALGSRLPPSRFAPERWMLRDHARRLAKLTAELSMEPLNTFDPAVFGARAAEQIPRWQIYSRQILPNLWDPWARTTRIGLSSELAALVIEERARLAAGGQIGESGLVPSQPSRIEGLTWRFERSADAVTISLDGELVTPAPIAPGKMPLPLSYTIHRGECAALS